MSEVLKNAFAPGAEKKSSGLGNLILSGVEAGSSFAAGSTQRAISERNARMQELSADVLLDDAHKQALVELQIGRIIQGEQASSFAAGGVVTTTGTPAIQAAAEASSAALRAASTITAGVSGADKLRADAVATRFEGKAQQFSTNTRGLLALTKGVTEFAGRKKSNA